MNFRILGAAAFWLAAVGCAHAQEFTEQPKIYGVVTDPGTPAKFQVDGQEILCSSSTEVQKSADHHVQLSKGCEPYRLGQGIAVYGKRHKHTVEATKLEPESAETHKVEGFAVIDLQPVQDREVWTVRADGYRLRVGPQTHSSFAPNSPVRSMGDLRPDMWVRYTGVQQRDGAVAVETAEFIPNNITKQEAKLREKREFDPAATTQQDRQSGLSEAFLGLDPKRFPATSDEALQQRVVTIGERLVPAYQKALPDDDPAKLNFRFQVVDQPKLHDAWTMPNGIILVPQQVLARLENDDEIAALLADNIAVALEKQEYRELPTGRALTATEIAGLAGELFVPGLGLATVVGTGVAGEKVIRNLEEQSGRVSLQLLHDAGFNIAQAPRTWWLLASLKPKPLEEIRLPYRAAYVYGQLFATWPPPQTTVTR